MSTPTTSTLFLQTLSSCGITHAFANWGSDHPALLEDLARQRLGVGMDDDDTTNPESNDGTIPRPKPITIITCPNEMVALSAAQAYAQTTGKPAAVFVHVDVGTQALAGAIHNTDRSRTPVLIYAGASPYSTHGEHKGGRDEWIMWMQDVHDQTAGVRGYMRFTGQIGSGETVGGVVRRALQIATSDPKGPVYIWARRETMEAPLHTLPPPSTLTLKNWPSTTPPALPFPTLTLISQALLTSHHPLIITSSLGQTPSSLPPLLSLSSLLHIPICSACPSSVNAPFSHPYTTPPTFLAKGTHTRYLGGADVVLVVACDLPWIDVFSGEGPREGARVFVVDGGDPLKRGMGYWHVAAEAVCNADPGVALTQIVDEVKRLDAQAQVPNLGNEEQEERGEMLRADHAEMVRELDCAEEMWSENVSVGNVIGVLRRKMREMVGEGGRSVVLNEAVSNYQGVWAHMRAEHAGEVISSGGSSLGWALGAAVGVSVGGREGAREGYKLIVAVVGDGSFLFGVPGSAYWMARKYNTPFLTIVLNNGGWKSPKLSMLRVHPTGHGSTPSLSGNDLTVGFGPHTPDYGQIAVAASAGWAWAGRVGVGAGREAVEGVIGEAIRVVMREGRCAVVECLLEGI